jgi:sucrose-6-phosphate hydrolase SacC (GH32 family)
MLAMRIQSYLLVLFCMFLGSACRSGEKTRSGDNVSVEFPKEMVRFVPYAHNPIFSGTDTDTWDRHIRERGYILYEDSLYKMWYTGYVGGDNDPKSLGYATSTDGIHWTRYPGNPIFTQRWTEDVYVIKNEGKYYMYAEGKNDVAHALISDDGLVWKDLGDLRMHYVNGDSIPGPYGTPTVWIENGKWYLFYERNDSAIWLATSVNPITWTNVQDEPVLKTGPDPYDAGAVAANQIIKFRDRYYMYYHGSSDKNWDKPGAASVWTSNVAMSTDLIHWKKYPGNPIVEGDHSSPILVFSHGKYDLYTMHDKIWLYLPR